MQIGSGNQKQFEFLEENLAVESTDRAVFAPAAIDSSTFTSNMSLPVHRWFRYSAGFSALWVNDCILSAKSKQDANVRVLDPFAGSGTVLLEAEETNVPSYGMESHPFVSRVAKAKITSGVEAEGFRRYAAAVLQ